MYATAEQEARCVITDGIVEKYGGVPLDRNLFLELEGEGNTSPFFINIKGNLQKVL